jgi:membrane protein YdbS with pleckstrin-like domain
VLPVPFPARLLNDGEEVVVDVRPHVWALAGPVAIALVAVAVAAVAAGLVVPQAVAWLLVGLLALALLNLVARYLRWRSTSLVVTTDRLVRRQGLLSTSGRDIPLLHLTDISYRQTIFERMIGAGDLLLESGGRDSREVFPDLPRPAEIQSEIYRVLSARQGARPVAAGLSLPEQLEKLDDLHRRGVLSDEEFAATKARLLQGR